MVVLDESECEDFGIENPRPQRIELAALTRGPEHSVSQANFRRLDGQVWLDDTIIDMFVFTYVNEYCEGVCCTRTHFMTKLLEGIEGDSDIEAVESVMENYCEVQDWDHGSAGGLAALDYLFVPINVENWHWIFLSVDLKGRKIASTTQWDWLTPGTGNTWRQCAGICMTPILRMTRIGQNLTTGSWDGRSKIAADTHRNSTTVRIVECSRCYQYT